MSRVNAHLRATSDRREVSLGGRSRNDRVRCWLNSDNAGGSDCCIKAEVEVLGEREWGGRPRKTCHHCGRAWVVDPEAGINEDDLTECPSCGHQRQGIDTRKSVFTVELPEPNGHCEVHIEAHGAALRSLAMMGAVLVGVKGLAEDDKADCDRLLKFSVETMREMEEQAKRSLPTVFLPGGVTLAHAMAAVEMCRRLAEAETESKN